jgi:beta-phosphoglucomutase
MASLNEALARAQPTCLPMGDDRVKVGVVRAMACAVFPATIFDFNGVLVDDELVHRDAFRDVLTPLGVSFSDDEYVERYLGFDDFGALRAMLSDAGRPASEQLVAELAEKKKPCYMRRAEHSLVIFEGAISVVERRAARGPVIIVSGALRHEIAFALERMGIASLFQAIVSAEDAPQGKPDPMGYRLGIAELSRLIGAEDALRALVIEDSLSGIAAAKGAGLACLAVAHSYPESQLLAAGADRVLAHIREADDATIDAMYARLTWPLSGR